jgi:hypothetical protein
MAYKETTMMKSILTHLLAVLCGGLAVFLWPQSKESSEVVTADAHNSGRKGVGLRSGSTADPHARTQDSQRQPGIRAALSRSVSLADLESWLSSKKGDTRTYAKALVTAGLITDDPELIRQGIEADPENPHLLFIGATSPAFSEEERLAMSSRLLAADPENALSGFVSAAHLMAAGQSEAAIQTLREAIEHQRMDDFRIPTQLSTEDAYIAAGLSPNAAKFRSAYDLKCAYLSDLRSLVNSMKGVEGTMPPEDASELRQLTALMGQRLSGQSRSGTMIDRMTGIALEEATLIGLPEGAPSPYEGLSVSQARESIAAERQELRKVMDGFGSAHDLLLNDPDLMSRYTDHVRLRGELEAAKWLVGATEGTR